MRARNRVASRKRRKRVLKAAKGFVGGRRKFFKKAKETLNRAGAYAFRDRRNKKRSFRALWNVRINAGVREHGIRYSTFINLLKKSGIDLNRKVLASLAAEEPTVFKVIIDTAKAKLN